jgi:NAD(P)-dependent dehydrogenase (short-subunit alcohol dehydrogenase family)
MTIQGKQVVNEISKTGGNVQMLMLDLLDLNSAKDLVKEVNDKLPKLDILILNAGFTPVMGQKTAQGFESGFGGMHLAHFYIFKGLLPLLKKCKTRVVTVASVGHRGATRADLFKGLQQPTFSQLAYFKSKMCNVLMALEIHRRYQELCSVTLHPGTVYTAIWPEFWKFKIGKEWFRGCFHFWAKLMMRTEEVGSFEILYAALAQSEKVAGKYLMRFRPSPGLSVDARDPTLATELWEMSEKFIEPYLK